MADTSTSVVNQALQLIGNNQPAVTGVAPTFDNSPAGIAASSLYALTVATVGRQFGWDFARTSFALVLSGNVAPFPWAFEYLYPSNGIQVWQLIPSTLADANNPLPVNWSVGNTQVNGVQKKVVWSNQANAVAVYNNSPTEATWDPIFQQAVVRLLASGLAMALAGKPDVATTMLDTGGGFASSGEKRDS